MATPSTGSISMAQIAAEFGGTAPHSLDEYYGVASGVPSSGTIDFNSLRGKSNLPPAYAQITITKAEIIVVPFVAAQ